MTMEQNQIDSLGAMIAAMARAQENGAAPTPIGLVSKSTAAEGQWMGDDTLPAAPAPAAQQDEPPITRSTYGSLEACEAEQARRNAAPTEQADSVDLELAAISKEIDRQLDGLMDLSESSFDPTTLALAKEVVKVVAERKAAELPALPARDGDWAGDDWFTTSTMQDYARTALARQSSRIRHLERERDMARKDCAALAARQAPTEAPKLNLCEHLWYLQPASPGARMTEKCRFCHQVREIATAQEKAQ